MKKRGILTIFILTFLYLSINPSAAMAYVPGDPGSDGGGGGLVDIWYESSCNEDAIGGDAEDKLLKFREDEASIPERFLVDVVIVIVIGLQPTPIPETILGNPYCHWTDSDEFNALAYGIFSEKEIEESIKPGMLIFTGIYGLAVTLSIMISALKLNLNSISPRSSTEFWEDVRMLIGSALFIACLWPFIGIIFTINDSIIKTIVDLMSEQGVNLENFTLTSENEYKSITDIFLHLAEWILTFVINIIYMARKMVMFIVLIISPIAGIVLLFKPTRQYFGIWIKTFISAVFIASLHAITLFIFVMVSQVVVQIDSFFFKVGMMLMFIPITTMIVSWIGMDNSASDLGQNTTKSISKGTKKAGQGIGKIADKATSAGGSILNKTRGNKSTKPTNIPTNKPTPSNNQPTKNSTNTINSKNTKL
ncbi:hypothetical protein QTG56_23875 (plasmid) [Rossellomorea sp. AcN35-11]|nr:hypothetical protein [Rossellomorea aquimaris]WJV32401.1 hypothetical protein QTG56_23875 [Rossellomorea sp. AcN35-11]